LRLACAFIEALVMSLPEALVLSLSKNQDKKEKTYACDIPYYTNND